MAQRAPVRYKINLKIDAAYRERLDPRVLRAAVRAALTHQAAPSPAELTLLLTGDAALQKLNSQFLGHNHPTDVLSFPSKEVDPSTNRRYLGDIAISIPTARRQAQSASHSLTAELQLLVVHGILHLLGHDHATPKDKNKMWTAQSEILLSIKAGITQPVDGSNSLKTARMPQRHPLPVKGRGPAEGAG
jgi:probable rRNA maturation factor